MRVAAVFKLVSRSIIVSDSTIPNTSSSSKYGTSTIVAETISVCQLQQPLLMSKQSSVETSELNVACSEFSSQISGIETKAMDKEAESTTSKSTVSDSAQSDEYQNQSTPFISEQPVQLNTAFIGCMNYQHPKPCKSTFTQLATCSPGDELMKASSSECQSTLIYKDVVATDQFLAQQSYESSIPAVLERSDCSSALSADDIQPSRVTISSTHAYHNSGSVAYQMPYLMKPNVNRDNDVQYNSGLIYDPVKPYWLFQSIVENKEIWYGFSNIDSLKLENAFQQDPRAVVPVDGGRYDALLSERIKKPVYYEAKELQIRRCMWFYHPDSSQCFVPFPEETADLLEESYHLCVSTGRWPSRVNLPGIGCVVFESSCLLLLYKNEVELWPSLPDSRASPKIVKRGIPENLKVMPDEVDTIDHLVFVVQGIGSFCDLRFRTVSECVDGFRDIANNLLSSHFRNEIESGKIGRVEFLPLAWHAKLHTSGQSFDCCMQNITLPSIPKLRHFTNDTLLDILLYSSPSYCQSIIDTVASELNRLYEIFLRRNSNFKGKVSVAGHSLGSLILFDILSNQKVGSEFKMHHELNSAKENDSKPLECSRNQNICKDNTLEANIPLETLLQKCNLTEYAEIFEKQKIDLSCLSSSSVDDLQKLRLPQDRLEKLLNSLNVQIIQNSSKAVETVSTLQSEECVSSGTESRNSSTDLTCLKFPLKRSPCMSAIVYPRLYFEPDCFFALGSPIAMFLAVRGYNAISEDFRLPSCRAFFHIFHPYDPVAFRIEPLIDPDFSVKPVLIPHHKGRKRMHLAPSEDSGEDIPIGSLNGGRRIDYVLQEKPIEALNDYIFALTSHSTYWDSEDTVLMILREIYAMQGIYPSSQSIMSKQLSQAMNSTGETSDYLYVIPDTQFSHSVSDWNDSANTMLPSSQNIDSVHNFPSSIDSSSATAPYASAVKPVGPPPLTGFVKRSPFAK